MREACQKLDLKEVQYHLCEVKSSGEVAKLSNEAMSVHSGMTVNGRLFIVLKKDFPKHLVRVHHRLTLRMMYTRCAHTIAPPPNLSPV